MPPKQPVRKQASLLAKPEFVEAYNAIKDREVYGRPIQSLTKEELIAVFGLVRLEVDSINAAFSRRFR